MITGSPLRETSSIIAVHRALNFEIMMHFTPIE